MARNRDAGDIAMKLAADRITPPRKKSALGKDKATPKLLPGFRVDVAEVFAAGLGE